MRLKRALEKWRADGRPGRKTPEHLWDEAIALAAGGLGVSQVARIAKLDHGKLKRLVEEARSEGALVPMESSPPTFVEFLATPMSQTISCVLEINSARGHLRADVSGLDASGLSALCREFGNL